MTDVRSVVVVGGGLAGVRTAQQLREMGYEGDLTIFAAESRLPYDRPPLSKGYLTGEMPIDEVVLHDEQWYADRRIDLRLGTGVVAVEAEQHRIVTISGDRHEYDRLVLATGSSPRRLDVPGAHLGGVHTLRTLDDSERLRAARAGGQRLVVVGGGWIGLEVAAGFRGVDAEVTVVEPEPQPLLKVLGPQLAEVFADLHRQQGVQLLTGASVERIDAEPDTRRVGSVVLTDGRRLPADLVLVGIGATPNVDLAVRAGLAVDDGVLVDAQGRTSRADIFAVGDIARLDHPVLGERVRVEHWATAHDQPAAVARGVLDRPGDHELLPFFYTDQYDLGMEYAGRAGSGDEVVVRGDVAAREFIAFWVRDGQVTAGMNVNVWDVSDDIQALITSKRRVSAEQLTNDEVSIADLAAGRG